MTARKDPAAERAVQAFMYEVRRRDRIERLCKKPTTSDRFWQGGYSAAMRELLHVMDDAMDRTGSPAHALHDVLSVVRANLELQDAEENVDQFVGDWVDRWTWPVSAVADADGEPPQR